MWRNEIQLQNIRVGTERSQVYHFVALNGLLRGVDCWRAVKKLITYSLTSKKDRIRNENANTYWRWSCEKRNKKLGYRWHTARCKRSAVSVWRRIASGCLFYRLILHKVYYCTKFEVCILIFSQMHSKFIKEVLWLTWLLPLGIFIVGSSRFPEYVSLRYLKCVAIHSDQR